MKACMVAYTFYESDNRVRRYAETLASRGDDVSVLSLRRKDQDFYNELNNVKIFRIQERLVDEKNKLSYLRKLLKFFVKSGIFMTKEHIRKPYDLVHVHSVPDFEVFAAFIPKLFGAKIILDIHDLVPEFYNSKFKNSIDLRLFGMLKFVEKISAGFSDHVIISNHLWKNVIVARSVPKGKCTTIINYPDLKIFHRKNNGLRDSKKVNLLYPGTLNWHQGLDIAINAFARIEEKVPEADFYIYGDGQSRRELSDLIQKHKLEQRIFLKDFVSSEEIVSIMLQSDIGVIPKRNDAFGGEAFSTKILEFMAMGIPSIVSRTKIDDFYFNETIVKFFAPDNEEELAAAMILLIKSKDLREKLSTNALNYVANNNWGVKKHKYLDLVYSLLQKKGKKLTLEIVKDTGDKTGKFRVSKNM